MHELNICRALLAQLEPLAAARRAVAIRRVVLRIGPLAGVEPRLLASAFPLASAGTVAEGAALEIEAAPLRVRCLDCGTESAATPNRLACSACGSLQTQLISGDELLLVSVAFIFPSRPVNLEAEDHV